jgi:hypothetical protein
MTTKSSLLTEFRKTIDEKMPDFLELSIYFSWDEGAYATELFAINKSFGVVEDQLSKCSEEDQILQASLKGQLMELVPQMETLYHKLTKTLSDEDWSQFRKWKK